MRDYINTILVVDDDQKMRDIVKDILQFKGYNVFYASNGAKALNTIKLKQVDAVLLDILMPGMNGITVLKNILKYNRSIPVIMISGHGTIKQAVESIKIGAYDFIEKPLEAERILLTLKNALEKGKLEREKNELMAAIKKNYEMIGSSQEMQNVYNMIEKAAPSSATVLISGESGTGKELVARAIHNNSPRVFKNFVRVNCAAIPHELIESELFGHTRGAFTGAFSRKEGKFQRADGGTLFLDEIGDMSFQTQSKVLRAIEEGEVEKLGSTTPEKVDVRLIASTNKDLKKLIEEKKFREDLYYRVNVISIHIPPLRERKEDIPRLVNYFIQKYCDENNRYISEITPVAMDRLLDYEWPGNVRELKNIIEKLVILSEKEIIDLEDVLKGLGEEKIETAVFSKNDLKLARDEFERKMIINHLISNNWSVAKAARSLNVERTNLYKKIKKLDIKLK